MVTLLYVNCIPIKNKIALNNTQGNHSEEKGAGLSALQSTLRIPSINIYKQALSA